jgi:hypothetical protein
MPAIILLCELVYLLIVYTQTHAASSLQEVTLSSTLFLGEYARPGRRVTFTCEARDASVMEWHSDEYIGSGGNFIEVVRNGDGNNQTRRGKKTVATTVSVTTYSGVTVIISQLHIMTSERFPTSSVTCAISGLGPRKVIPFIITSMEVSFRIRGHFQTKLASL